MELASTVEQVLSLNSLLLRISISCLLHSGIVTSVEADRTALELLIVAEVTATFDVRVEDVAILPRLLLLLLLLFSYYRLLLLLDWSTDWRNGRRHMMLMMI